MSSRLRVDRVALAVRGSSYAWDFAGPVTVLQGPVGVGKTSLLELIKYGFGNNGLLSKTIRDVGVRVALTINVPSGEYVLLRGIGHGANSVRVVTGDGQPVTTLPVRTSQLGEPSISSWLLDQLRIPSAMRLPRSRARPRDEYTRITFGDVFTYLYLEQSEIDRSTAHDLDPIRDPKRRQTFELLYRLLGPDIAALQVSIAELESKIREARAGEASIADFLARLTVPDGETIKNQRATLRGHLADVERTLVLARRDAHDKTVTLDLPRGEVDDLRNEVHRAEAERRLAAQELEALTRLRARISLEHERTVKAPCGRWRLRGHRLGHMPSVPAGAQDRASRPPLRGVRPAGTPTMPPDELEAEQDRLRRQIGETDLLIVRARRAVDAAEDRQLRTARILAQREADMDRTARESVAPYVDRIAELTGDAARLDARLQELDRWQRLADELAAQRRSRAEDERQLQELNGELASARDEADVARARISELSSLFGQILERFEQPWFMEQGGRAVIDPKTYRPVVNGQNLPEQMSGGMKVLTNVAYYLAGLTYALQSPNDSLMPTFMILDTHARTSATGSTIAGLRSGSTTGSTSCVRNTAIGCSSSSRTTTYRRRSARACESCNSTTRPL